MRLGYMRVSKDDGSQSLDLQQDALLAAGVDLARLYQDTASGKRDDRPGLLAYLKALQPGNTLVVWKLDRLGRDLAHLVRIVDDLTARQVVLRVLTGMGAQLNTSTAEGRMLFGFFAVLAEYERGLLIERTKAGLAAARARGRVGGRRRTITARQVRTMMAELRDKTSTVVALAQDLGIHRATVYEYVRPDGTPTARGRAVLQGKVCADESQAAD